MNVEEYRAWLEPRCCAAVVPPGEKPQWRDLERYRCPNPAVHVEVLPADCCCGEVDCGSVMSREARMPLCDEHYRPEGDE